MVPLIQKIVLGLADVTAAVAQAGAQAHAGNLVLAKITSSVQKARPVPACLHSALEEQRSHRLLATRVEVLLCWHSKVVAHQRSARLCVQLLRDGAGCCSAASTSCLTVDTCTSWWRRLQRWLAACAWQWSRCRGRWPSQNSSPTIRLATCTIRWACNTLCARPCRPCPSSCACAEAGCVYYSWRVVNVQRHARPAYH